MSFAIGKWQISLSLLSYCSSCRKVRRAAGELRILQPCWACWPKSGGGSSVCFWQSPQSCHPARLAVGVQEESWAWRRGRSSVSSRAARGPGGAAQVPDRAVHLLLLPVPQPLPPALQEPLQAGLPVHLQQNPQGEPWAQANSLGCSWVRSLSVKIQHFGMKLHFGKSSAPGLSESCVRSVKEKISFFITELSNFLSFSRELHFRYVT